MEYTQLYKFSKICFYNLIVASYRLWDHFWMDIVISCIFIMITYLIMELTFPCMFDQVFGKGK